MSGSVAPVTPAEAVDIRRWCGYPPLSRLRGPDVIGRAIAAMPSEELAAIRAVFLVPLAKLEAAIPGASKLLHVAEAGPLKRNPRELVEREDLFRGWRLKLCYTMGIEPGPTLDLMLPGIFVV